MVSTILNSHHALHIYTVSQKNNPDIFDRNLKTNYQISIIFGKNIFDATCYEMVV